MPTRRGALTCLTLPCLLLACSDDTSNAGALTPVDSGAISPDASPDAPEPEEKRPQDDRMFQVDESSLAFDALAGGAVETDRIVGVLNGAGYRIEVPKNWNGMLVMYAHGYVGTGSALVVTTPSLRPYWIANGYAWAASSYSKNYYDVRAGIEDTNALALAFVSIVAQKSGRTVAPPSKTYIVGHSMGGHISGAAVEDETGTTANSKVHYDGAVPMCGVVGDIALFKYFAAYQLAAQYLAGYPATSWPVDFPTIQSSVQNALFTTFPSATTPLGDKLKAIVQNLTGGQRVNFEQGFASAPTQIPVWSTFGGDGTINGILNSNVVDTHDVVFQLDADPAMSSEERALSDAIYRVTAVPDANRLRRDGLRWIPVVGGKFRVPVVTLHDLGDLYVPFMNEQVYRQKAVAGGSDPWLVQRAVRGTNHCEFTYAEQVAAFEAMIGWEQKGVKPDGDEVLDAAVVSGANYGCKFTVNTFTDDEKASGLPATRALVPACAAP